MATSLFNQAGVRCSIIGKVTPDKKCEIRVAGAAAISGSTAALRDVWEETSFALERLQVGVLCGGEGSPGGVRGASLSLQLCVSRVPVPTAAEPPSPNTLKP
jgi:hypothetical protein